MRRSPAVPAALLGSLLATAGAGAYELGPGDAALLDEIVDSGCAYFLEHSHPETGLTRDRAAVSGPEPRRVASIAATGFGLTALCIAAERGHVPRAQAFERARKCLDFLFGRPANEHGFFYHFVDWETGERAGRCEASSIDTAILLCGVLACGAYFRDGELSQAARAIYERVDWTWLLEPDGTLSHGFRPETGRLRSRWDHYCELLVLYLLALGSPTHSIPAASWDAFRRPIHDEEGLRYIGSPAPLFVHQYSHAWLDFRGRRDAYADYFENSVAATRAHYRFCLSLVDRFPHFGEELWGITASDGKSGYVVWGGPPEMGPLDGTVVPCAAAGSLPFLPGECLRVLRHLRESHAALSWTRYGFADALDPVSGWAAPDAIGIDVGISVLMAENLRSGFVWRLLEQDEAIQRAWQRAGFERGGRR